MEANTASTLLALPVELVTRITDFLDKEHLLMVRLACKSLDTITFDRFAEEYFAHVYCWIAASKSYDRLRTIIGDSSRLRGRVRQLTFTANILEEQSVDFVHAVLKERQIDVDARKESMLALWQTQPNIAGDPSPVRQTLLDAGRLPQDVKITFDFTGMAGFMPTGFGEAVLSSIAATQTSVSDLTVYGGVFTDMQKTLTHNPAQLAASMASLESFTFAGDSPNDWDYHGKDLSIIAHILQSAKQLRRLKLQLYKPVLNPGWSATDIERINELDNFGAPDGFGGMLFFNDLANLTSLHLSFALTHKEKLLEACRRCRNTLTRFVIRTVMLTPSISGAYQTFDVDNGWIDIVQALVEMPKLAGVELLPRAMPPDEHDDRRESASRWEDVRLEGRRSVELGLQAVVKAAPYVMLDWSVEEPTLT